MSNRERDRRICLLRRSGFTFSQIAQMEDISRVRVAQIVKEYNTELGEDEGRAEIASALEFAEQKCVELITSPGWKLGPDGKAARGPEGEAMTDNGIVIEALKTLVLVEDKRSRLFGWDKQQTAKRIADEEAKQRAAESLAALAVSVAADRAAIEQRHRLELEAARRGPLHPTVAGEVEREEVTPLRPAGR